MDGLGIYFIQTTSALATLTRWLWQTDYDMLGIQLPRGSEWILYIVDLATLLSPVWFSREGQMTKTWNPNSSIITHVQFRSVQPSSDIQALMAKFVLHCCMREWTPEQQQELKHSHWYDIIYNQWHPEKNLPILQSNHFLSHHWISIFQEPTSHHLDDVSQFCRLLTSHATCQTDAIPIPQLQESIHQLVSRWDESHYLDSQSFQTAFPWINETDQRDDICLVSVNALKKIESTVSEWIPAIDQEGTPIVHLNQLVSSIQELCPSTPLTLREGTTSYPAIMAVLPLSQPTSIQLPSLSMSQPVYVSIMNPDLRFMTIRQIIELQEVLHSSDYFTNPMLDELRERAKHSLTGLSLK